MERLNLSYLLSLNVSFFRTMLSRLFRKHGSLCAERPWEVIIGTVTLTVSILSMSLFATDKVCGWNYICEDRQSEVINVYIVIYII